MNYQEDIEELLEDLLNLSVKDLQDDLLRLSEGLDLEDINDLDKLSEKARQLRLHAQKLRAIAAELEETALAAAEEY